MAIAEWRFHWWEKDIEWREKERGHNVRMYVSNVHTYYPKFECEEKEEEHARQDVHMRRMLSTPSRTIQREGGEIFHLR